jgi:hypothetical protein
MASSNLLSVCMDLPILDISYKWHYTICGLLCQHLLLCMFWRFIHATACLSISFLLCLNDIPLYGYRPQFSPFFSWWTFGLFPPFWYYK